MSTVWNNEAVSSKVTDAVSCNWPYNIFNLACYRDNITPEANVIEVILQVTKVTLRHKTGNCKAYRSNFT